MELSWINKLRIAAVAGLGILVLGMLAWPLAAPADPMAPVRAWDIGFLGTIVLLVLAVGLGFVGYFIAWPHGREIGILAVPFGLMIWASRSGPLRVLTQEALQPPERMGLASSLRFEPIYWLLLVVAGFVGVLLAQHWRPASWGEAEETGKTQDRNASSPSRPSSSASGLPAAVRTFVSASLLSGLLGLAAAVLLGQFFVGAFVQDVATSRNIAPTQPEVGQIIFGVIAAFAVAGFVVKKFGNLGYLWPILASAFITLLVQAAYYGPETMRQFVETRPATFFPHSALAVLPIQLVALGTLGSILGYWMAVRYDWWRTHESSV